MAATTSAEFCREVARLLDARDADGGLSLAEEGLRRFPDSPDLLATAGHCCLVAGQDEQAMAWYRRALAAAPPAAPAVVESAVNLGFLLRKLQRLAEARDVLRSCIATVPRHRAAWLTLVGSYVNEDEPVAGAAVARAAIAACGPLPELRWSLALLLLEQQAWREGWEHYRSRAEIPGFLPWSGGLGPRPPRLERLADVRAGTRVLVVGEQGLGDEILFAGMLAEFAEAVRDRGGSVSLAANPRLAAVFRASFDPGLIRVLATPPAARSASGPAGSAFAWHAPIGDLGGFLRNEPADFPRHAGYLRPDPGLAGPLRSRLDAAARGRPLVGLAWSGGLPRTHAVHRRIPLVQWLPLLRDDACFVSLEYRDDEDEITSLRRDHGIDVVRLPQITRHADYAHTFALVAAIDLVVTVPTSVLHVAGAIGRECWVAMHHRAAWRERATDDSIPWYPATHRRFVRGADDGDWQPVMAQLAAALQAWKRRRESGAAT